MYFYGLIGAHRTGKTSLAKLVARELGVPFHETDLSKILREAGIDPQADADFATRQDIQIELFDGLLSGYQEALDQHPKAGLILVDRTPLDILAYSQSEILRETMTPRLDEAFSQMRRLCYEAMQRTFYGACLVQPGIKIVADREKATPNTHYQRHIHANMLEVVSSPDNTTNTLILPNNALSITDRSEHVKFHVHAIMTQALTNYKGATKH